MILIGIGANLPGHADRTALATCRIAAGAIARLPGLRLRALSRWYRSAPIPPSGQPDYVNGVAALDGTIDAAELLAALQAIEAAHGRVRSLPNAARTLDLDVVAMGGLIRDTPDPVLPHPRAHERGFVLRPLAEVASGWRHPRSGAALATLIAALPPQDLQVILGQ